MAGLGSRLGELLHSRDERAQALGFRDWAIEFYDAFGQGVWRTLEGATLRA